ncbi:hypothetical protein NDU88_002816 [Pleurodeles waltl]|uniref:Uncharacterized protein n=1 Tax=Pleurodeles waltl TaxID=8319 RepID=A0AAV7TP68_PLEWA|nr:hypothetical protein NDU88_002816 [Pleurodeles waltl]
MSKVCCGTCPRGLRKTGAGALQEVPPGCRRQSRGTPGARAGIDLWSLSRVRRAVVKEEQARSVGAEEASLGLGHLRGGRERPRACFPEGLRCAWRPMASAATGEAGRREARVNPTLPGRCMRGKHSSVAWGPLGSLAPVRVRGGTQIFTKERETCPASGLERVRVAPLPHPHFNGLLGRHRDCNGGPVPVKPFLGSFYVGGAPEPPFIWPL